MPSIELLKASDGTGNASVATVQNVRSPGATTIIVDTVAGINSEFSGSMGTPHTFIDPVTSEEITVISEATCVDFQGHIDGGDLEIDTIAPGYSDLGSQVGDIVIIRPTTQWSDEVAEVLETAHNDDGSLKATAFSDYIQETELIFDHIASGCVLTGTGYGSTLAWSLTAGVVYINGRRYTVAAATGVVVATKDTYFDVLMPVSGLVASLVYTGGNSVAVNAASPALAANSIRIAIIQSGANIASVAAINQGQEFKLLPITSSTPYQVTDSLGNLICPRDPNRKLLGYRQSTINQAINTGAYTDVTGLNVPVKVPAGRRVVVTAKMPGVFNSTSGNGAKMNIYDVTSSVNVVEDYGLSAATNGGFALNPSIPVTPPTSGARTYKSQVAGYGSSTSIQTFNLAGFGAMWLKIELE